MKYRIYTEGILSNFQEWQVNFMAPSLIIYTPILFQSTLEHLGYPNVIKFQIDYELPQTGKADPTTQNVLATTVRSLKHNINLVFEPANRIKPTNFYDETTILYVQEFQQRMGLPPDGIADLRLRIHLDRWAKNGWVCGYAS